MSKTGDLVFELIKIWADENELYSKQGKVVSVDEGNRTCIVRPTDGGPDVLDVFLEADVDSSTAKGFYVVPAVDSLVGITFMSREEAFISVWSSIDKVIAKQGQWTFNDGDNGGLIKITDQTEKLNDLILELQEELVKIATGISGAGGAYTPGTLTQIDSGDFENELVKH